MRATLLYIMVVPMVGFLFIAMQQSGKQQVDPIELPAEDLIRVLKMKKLTDVQRTELAKFVDIPKENVECDNSKKTQVPVQAQSVEKEYTVTLRYMEGTSVTWNDSTVVRVESAKWGGGTVGSRCKAILWGKEETKLHCYQELQPCRDFADVTSKVTKNIQVIKDSLGQGACPDNQQVLEVVMTVTKPPPTYSVQKECNENAVAVHANTAADGYVPVCVCKPQFKGAACDACKDGFHNYPWCTAEAFKMEIETRKPTPTDHNCPDGLVQPVCDMLKYPRPLLQPMLGPAYMGIIGCSVASQPWGCELGSQTTAIKSLCTLVTGEFVGAHLMLLFESIRVFAPQVPFIIGVDQYSAITLIPKMKEAMEGRGVTLHFIALHKTPIVPFWFHEKPNLMKKALEMYENTLWLDADTFLVAPLAEVPNVPAASFGFAVHDPRGWGSGLVPQLYGYANTGVVYARRGSPHLDAWMGSMQRFEHRDVHPDVWQGMESLYLDQGPIDISIASTRGAFKLEPHWNVGWWTPDKRLEQDGRPNWWIANNFPSERISLSPAKDAVLLDGAPMRVVHSHYIKEEKAYGKLDLYFNTVVYDYIQQAAPGTLLAKFAPRLARYATHVEHPDPNAVHPKKGSMEFLATLKNWD
eukprot:TRINITY_DN25125_c3_g1_i1.p1 TRINITY_DN25125_c3_g1~~TRINITY_DN25125_c3_g1_i1.p1  ORF type:complete len:638 (+),score=144.32 TRINITY_DN25125_c3_g1_i1:59-1972(+)